MNQLSRRSVLVLGGALCLGVGGYAYNALLNPRAAGALTMTPDDAFAAAAVGDILLVDVRRPDEWEATGVPRHAVAFDLREDGFLESVRRARSSEDQPIVLICARGVRSARLTARLAEAGLEPIVDVPEGILGSLSGPGWLKRGLPVAWPK